MKCQFHLQTDCPDELGVGYDDDGDGDGQAEGVDEDDVPHVGVQGRLGPNNATAELKKYQIQMKQSYSTDKEIWWEKKHGWPRILTQHTHNGQCTFLNRSHFSRKISGAKTFQERGVCNQFVRSCGLCGIFDVISEIVRK